MVTLEGAAISYFHYGRITCNSDTRERVGHKHTAFNTARAEGSLIIKPPLTDGIKGEREKLESSASVELVLELNPARGKSVYALKRQLSDTS